MGTFNATKFLATHGTPKTRIKTKDGISLSLNGMAAKLTPAELVKVADKNFKTKVSLPKGQVGDNIVKRDTTLTGSDVSQFVSGILGHKAEASDSQPEGGENSQTEGAAA